VGAADERLYGLNLFGEVDRPFDGILARRFVVPPFSTLDARQGYWQDRRRAWLALGIRSELGREDTRGLYETMPSWLRKDFGKVSIFDPVLTEAAYSWWCPPGGQVLDPFAGGSVRGIVAAVLGLEYWGCELRPQQVEENRQQAEEILGLGHTPRPHWVIGDSCRELERPEVPEADLVWSCPPYGDLERYSDDPADISTYDYPGFLAALRRILFRAYLRLRDDRFFALVVGDFREVKSRHLRGFPDAVIDCCCGDIGMVLYNRAVLLTPLGTLPVRQSHAFDGNRLLRPAHQEVLVFCKGDVRAAAAAARGPEPEPEQLEEAETAPEGGTGDTGPPDETPHVAAEGAEDWRELLEPGENGQGGLW
jgi:hypothetical protein